MHDELGNKAKRRALSFQALSFIYLFFTEYHRTIEPSDAAKRSGSILDGKGGRAKVTPLTKGLGFIVTHACRYVGEKNMCIQERI